LSLELGLGGPAAAGGITDGVSTPREGSVLGVALVVGSDMTGEGM